MSGTDGLSRGVLDTLQRLGLTEYGARCYASLVGMGAAEASALADAAHVPRTRVYGVLKDLVDAGWVVAEGGRPARYRAAPPEERIARAEKELAEASAAAVRELQARHQMAAEMMALSIYLLRGAPLITRKTVELLHRARGECIVVLGFLLPGEARELAEAMAVAKRRGARVQLLVAKPPLAGPLPGLAELREFLPDARLSPLPFRAVFVDQRQGLVVMPQPDAPPESIVGLWNPVEEFMAMLVPIFRGALANAPRFDG